MESWMQWYLIEVFVEFVNENVISNYIYDFSSPGIFPICILPDTRDYLQMWHGNKHLFSHGKHSMQNHSAGIKTEWKVI